jgi:uncharacterized cupin superfamily protein
MSQIRKIAAASAPLESWQPVGVTIHEGDPDGHGYTLAEREEAPEFGTGIFACQPGKTTYELVSNEIIYVLEGSVTIQLEGQEPVDMEVGDLVFLPKGNTSTWTFHEPFKEVWFLVD